MQIQTATLGYPRIGKNREVKKALEAFWSGNIESESLLLLPSALCPLPFFVKLL